MKIRRLTLGEKTYETGRITAYIARKALEINAETLEFLNGELAAIESGNRSAEDVIASTRKKLELNTEAAWIICQAYGEKFGIDELERSMTHHEIAAEVTAIANGIFEEIEKNA